MFLWRLIFASLALVAAQALATAETVSFRLTDAKGAPVADAVVSLHPLEATEAAPGATAPPAPVTVAQRDEAFVPYVTAVRVGTPVVFPNEDAVRHHVYSLSKAKPFEIPLFGKDAQSTIVLDQPGVVTLGCNIHDWMIGYVVVLPTPHFAKTGADGKASVNDVPAGRYRAEIWHPRLAQIVKQEITLNDTAPAPEIVTVLTLKPDRRIRRAPDGARGGYP